MSLNPYEPPREPAEPPGVPTSAPWNGEQQSLLLKIACVPATSLFNFVALFTVIRLFADANPDASLVLAHGFLVFGIAFFTWRSRHTRLWLALQFVISSLVIAMGGVS